MSRWFRRRGRRETMVMLCVSLFLLLVTHAYVGAHATSTSTSTSTPAKQAKKTRKTVAPTVLQVRWREDPSAAAAAETSGNGSKKQRSWSWRFARGVSGDVDAGTQRDEEAKRVCQLAAEVVEVWRNRSSGTTTTKGTKMSESSGFELDVETIEMVRGERRMYLGWWEEFFDMILQMEEAAESHDRTQKSHHASHREIDDNWMIALRALLERRIRRSLLFDSPPGSNIHMDSDECLVFISPVFPEWIYVNLSIHFHEQHSFFRAPEAPIYDRDHILDTDPVHKYSKKGFDAMEQEEKGSIVRSDDPNANPSGSSRPQKKRSTSRRKKTSSSSSSSWFREPEIEKVSVARTAFAVFRFRRRDSSLLSVALQEEPPQLIGEDSSILETILFSPYSESILVTTVFTIMLLWITSDADSNIRKFGMMMKDIFYQHGISSLAFMLLVLSWSFFILPDRVSDSVMLFFTLFPPESSYHPHLSMGPASSSMVVLLTIVVSSAVAVACGLVAYFAILYSIAALHPPNQHRVGNPNAPADGGAAERMGNEPIVADNQGVPGDLDGQAHVLEEIRRRAHESPCLLFVRIFIRVSYAIAFFSFGLVLFYSFLLSFPQLAVYRTSLRLLVFGRSAERIVAFQILLKLFITYLPVGIFVSFVREAYSGRPASRIFMFTLMLVLFYFLLSVCCIYALHFISRYTSFASSSTARSLWTVSSPS